MNYLVCGSSFKLVELEIEKILCGRKAETYSLEEVNLKEILEDVGYESMFEEEKILILKDFESIGGSKGANESALTSLEAYLNNPNEHTTLIFVSKEKIGSKGPLKKIVSKLKVVETLIINKPYELVKTFGEVVRKEGYGMSQNVLNVFCEKCASSYDLAMNEFEKLKKIKGENKIITEDDLEYVSNYNMSDSFGFKDAVINQNTTKAIKMLDDLESSKMEVLPIVVMLAKEYEAVYNIKLLASKKLSNDQISAEMGGMHPYRVKLLREAGNRYSNTQLEKAIMFLCDLDRRLVSEDNLGYDELRKFFLEI